MDSLPIHLASLRRIIQKFCRSCVGPDRTLLVVDIDLCVVALIKVGLGGRVGIERYGFLFWWQWWEVSDHFSTRTRVSSKWRKWLHSTKLGSFVACVFHEGIGAHYWIGADAPLPCLHFFSQLMRVASSSMPFLVLFILSHFTMRQMFHRCELYLNLSYLH